MNRWISVVIKHNGAELLNLQTDSLQVAVNALGDRLEKLLVQRTDLVEIRFEYQ